MRTTRFPRKVKHWWSGNARAGSGRIHDNRIAHLGQDGGVARGATGHEALENFADLLAICAHRWLVVMVFRWLVLLGLLVVVRQAAR